MFSATAKESLTERGTFVPAVEEAVGPEGEAGLAGAIDALVSAEESARPEGEVRLAAVLDTLMPAEEALALFFNNGVFGKAGLTSAADAAVVVVTVVVVEVEVAFSRFTTRGGSLDGSTAAQR